MNNKKRFLLQTEMKDQMRKKLLFEAFMGKYFAEKRKEYSEPGKDCLTQEMMINFFNGKDKKSENCVREHLCNCSHCWNIYISLNLTKSSE